MKKITSGIIALVLVVSFAISPMKTLAYTGNASSETQVQLLLQIIQLLQQQLQALLQLQGTSVARETKNVTMNRPVIEVLYPDGGEKLKKGEQYKLRWKATNLLSDKVDLYSISSDGTTQSNIAMGVRNTGSYKWRVPTSHIEGAQRFHVSSGNVSMNGDVFEVWDSTHPMWGSVDEEVGTDITSSGKVLGNPDAPLTMYAFIDTQSSFVEKWYKDTLPLLKEQWVGNEERLNIVFYAFPLIALSDTTMDEAIALECASQQNKYFSMLASVIDVVHQNSEADLEEKAKIIDLDIRAFKSCFSSQDTKDEIQRSIDKGTNEGVQGAPVFLVGESVIMGAQPYAVFNQILNNELKEKQ